MFIVSSFKSALKIDSIFNLRNYMKSNDFEIAKINRNMIRLAEFVFNIKKEKIKIPKILSKELSYFTKHSFGVDFENKDYLKLIEKYQQNIQSSIEKMKDINVNDEQILNAKIFLNILGETNFQLKLFLDCSFELQEII